MVSEKKEKKNTEQGQRIIYDFICLSIIKQYYLKKK